MTIKVTTLLENSRIENKKLAVEHGLSLFIEIGQPIQRKILFDTGQSGKFIENARLLNIDLALTDTVVLSHGHYDHSGGFKEFVKTYGGGFELFVGDGFFTPKYARDNGQWRFLGNNFTAESLKRKEIRTTVVTEHLLEMFPGVFLLRNFPRTNDFELPNPRFYLLKDGDYEPDLFCDEVVIVLQTVKGLLVLVGCSHPGVVNILTAVQTRLKQPVDAVLGGTHLVEANDERLDKTFAHLAALDLSLLGLSHCTGDYALNRLQRTKLPHTRNATGTSISFRRR